MRITERTLANVRSNDGWREYYATHQNRQQ